MDTTDIPTRGLHETVYSRDVCIAVENSVIHTSEKVCTILLVGTNLIFQSG